ncbi:DJ-1/PfpI family protein [Lysobacter korlensis]|uniref:DJ-1/PfpI family protein n=1 Tax=Lysobacter korlensis TaxID=553636 RepID=A0ABV6RQU5_9GAMM
MPTTFLNIAGAVGLLLAAQNAVAAAPAASPAQPKILVVVSSESRDEGKTRAGFEMSEFSQAWAIFRDNGYAVDVASPAGGRVEADRYNPKEPFNARVLADPDAVGKLAATLPTAKVRPGDYSAIYIVGGKGAMFDLPVDPALKSITASVYERGGVVSAVCHGPAAFVDVRLSNGDLLVKGKRLTGLTNEEETVLGKKWIKEFRFLLEDAMRERGARWEEAPLMMPKLVVDGRLVTGQNLFSTPAVAEAVVHALGREPVARQPWRDEASMRLVQTLLDGKHDEAHAALAEEPERYHVKLIGMLGYYQLKAVQTDAEVRNALAIMELARPYMTDPQLGVGIAEARWRLGERDEARRLIAGVLQAHPELAEAKMLQTRMDD